MFHESNNELLEFDKIKDFYSAKENAKGMRRQRHRLAENICRRHIWWKSVIQIYEELIKANKKKATCLKNGPKILIDTSSEKLCIWQRSL